MQKFSVNGEHNSANVSVSTQKLQLSDHNGASKWTFSPSPGQYHFVCTCSHLKFMRAKAEIVLPPRTHDASIVWQYAKEWHIQCTRCPTLTSWQCPLLTHLFTQLGFHNWDLGFQDYIWLLIFKLLVELNSEVHRRYVRHSPIVYAVLKLMAYLA